MRGWIFHVVSRALVRVTVIPGIYIFFFCLIESHPNACRKRLGIWRPEKMKKKREQKLVKYFLQKSWFFFRFDTVSNNFMFFKDFGVKKLLKFVGWRRGRKEKGGRVRDGTRRDGEEVRDGTGGMGYLFFPEAFFFFMNVNFYFEKHKIKFCECRHSFYLWYFQFSFLSIL